MNPDDAIADDETRVSEITILPDGRICIFGMSRQLLEILDEWDLRGPDVRQRVDHLRACQAAEPRRCETGSAGAGQPRPAAARRLGEGESQR